VGTCSIVPDKTPCTPDAIDCTADECNGGICRHPVSEDACFIGGECFALGDLHPLNSCLSCKAEMVDTWTPAEDGEACDDGLFCTEGDSCMTGACLPGNLRDCPEENICQAGFCNEDTDTCDVLAKNDGFPCDDGDPCSLGDACSDTECTGVPRDCSGSAQGQCMAAYCDPLSQPVPGACVTAEAPNGLPCSDGLACTAEDLCLDGACVAGSNVCVERTLNTTTQLAWAHSYGDPLFATKVGESLALAAWRAGDQSLSAAFFDADGSKSWPEVDLAEGFPAVQTDCYSVLGHPVVAGQPDGTFIVAVARKYALVSDDPAAPGECCPHYEAHHQYLFTVRHWDGSVLKPWTLLDEGVSDAKTLACVDEEGCETSACAAIPDGIRLENAVGNAVALPDGAFAVTLRWDTQTAFVFHVTPEFQAQKVADFGFVYRPRLCALPSGNMVFVSDNNAGYGSYSVLAPDGTILSPPKGVTDTTGGQQSHMHCAAFPDGRFLVTFNNSYNNPVNDVYAQLFGEDGLPGGSAFRVNEETEGSEWAVTAPATLPDGSFLAAWVDRSDPKPMTPTDVECRVMSFTGIPLTPDIRLNELQGANQNGAVPLAFGDSFGVAWRKSPDESAAQFDLRFRNLSKLAEPGPGAAERPLATGAGDDTHAGIAAMAGGFAVVYENEGPEGEGRNVSLRILDTDGGAVFGPGPLSEAAAGEQTDPAVAFSPAGNLLLAAWSDSAEGIPTAKVRILSQSGMALTQPETLLPAAVGAQRLPALATMPGGGFAAAWAEETPGDPTGPYVSLAGVDSTGKPTGLALSMGSALPGARPVLSRSPGDGSNLVFGWLSQDGTKVTANVLLLGEGFAAAMGGLALASAGTVEGFSLHAVSDNRILGCWSADEALTCTLYDGSFAIVTGPVIVDAGPAARFPAGVGFADGSFAVAFDKDAADADATAVALARVDADGNASTPSMLANWHEAGEQHAAFAAVHPASGALFVGWQSAGQDADGTGLYSRVFK
jgi:hypothetical protein